MRRNAPILVALLVGCMTPAEAPIEARAAVTRRPDDPFGEESEAILMARCFIAGLRIGDDCHGQPLHTIEATPIDSLDGDGIPLQRLIRYHITHELADEAGPRLLTLLVRDAVKPAALGGPSLLDQVVAAHRASGARPGATPAQAAWWADYMSHLSAFGVCARATIAPDGDVIDPAGAPLD